MSLPHIQLMTRQHCCLCDQAKEVLEKTASQGLCSWEPVNVDTDKALLVRYGMDVPVLVCEGKMLFKHRVTAEALQAALTGIVSAEVKG
ncbi:MAG: glutaredoxin family protein [Mariprofundus sp.]